MIIIKEIGRKIFHLSFINISYRNRGYVPRIQIKENEIKIMKKINGKVFRFLKNKIVEIILKITILMYSAKKIMANHPPMYSTLNPDTSSDSPSAKSKGLRFVSAKHEIIQKINRIEFPQKNSNINWDSLIWVNKNDWDIKIMNKIIMKNEISYEIICATLRIDPK